MPRKHLRYHVSPLEYNAITIQAMEEQERNEKRHALQAQRQANVRNAQHQGLGQDVY